MNDLTTAEKIADVLAMFSELDADRQDQLLAFVLELAGRS